MKSTDRPTPPPAPAPPLVSRVAAEPATVAACNRDYAGSQTAARAALTKQLKG